MSDLQLVLTAGGAGFFLGGGLVLLLVWPFIIRGHMRTEDQP